MAMNILVFASLFTSLIGLILIYIAAINIKPVEIKINQINSDLIGRSVSTEGKIVEKKLHSEGHMFLIISDDDSEIQVPIFSSLMNDLNKENITELNFEINGTISVIGLIDEYRGQLQILSRKTSDIKIGG